MQSRLDLIRKGQKTKSVTGVNEKKNAIFHKTGSKYIVTEKEKKVEEAGVTRKKRNYVMFESKIGTEIEKDKMKIANSKPKPEIRPRVEEKIISQRRHKEYLDNYQYQETKELKYKKPAVVVHERLSPVIGGSVEEVSYQKTTLRSGSAGKNSRPGGGRTTTTTTTTTRTDMKDSKSTTNVRSRPGQDRPGKQEKPTRPPRPESGGPFVTTKTETTRIGKRSGPTAGQAKTTTKTTVTTAQDGISKTQSSTKTTTTRTRK